MGLTEEQIKFLDKVCKGRLNWTLNSEGKVDVDGAVYMVDMNLTEIPVKFGRVKGCFTCNRNNLTTLKNCPDYIGDTLNCHTNNLTEYFKNIKEEDFPHWEVLNWWGVINDYPFLINIATEIYNSRSIRGWLNMYPLTKLYLK